MIATIAARVLMIFATTWMYLGQTKGVGSFPQEEEGGLNGGRAAVEGWMHKSRGGENNIEGVREAPLFPNDALLGDLLGECRKIDSEENAQFCF